MTIALFLMAQPDVEGKAETIAQTFGVDWPHLIAQTVSFSIVCALLYWLAYRPVLRVLVARRQQIAQGLANADRIRAELEATETKRREVLAQAGVEATRLIDEARAAAARVRADETRKASETAEQIVARAREAAEADRARMLDDVRREVTRLVLHTTAAVTGKVLTADDQRRLSEETARQLES